MDGCDFDVDAYLENCYCTDSASGQSVFGYGRYDNYHGSGHNYAYYDGNNNDFVQYLNLLLNTVILGYIFSIHSGCCCGGGKRKTFKKVDFYGDSADESERNAINA